MIASAAESDAVSGVMRYMISGVTYRARMRTAAEAILWSAMGLHHAAIGERRRYDDMGRPPPPPGIPSLDDLAASWDNRVRLMVGVAVETDGYEGCE